MHILISIPPQMTVGSLVRLLKTNTARNIKTKFSFLKKTIMVPIVFGQTLDEVWMF